MSRIYVANLASLAASVERVRPRRVLTVIDPGTPLPELPDVAPGDHLRLFFHDVVEPGLADGLLVHCYAGVSRSTASAYILLCLHNPGREGEAARLLRTQAGHAIPNRRMVELADDLLGRGGRMIDAVDAMDPPTAPAFSELIELPVRL